MAGTALRCRPERNKKTAVDSAPRPTLKIWMSERMMEKTKAKLRISLICMPFASLSTPSIALTQLKSLVRKRFGGQVSVEILYFNHNFARYIGDAHQYEHTMSQGGFVTGIGDWFFRQSAWPEISDNATEYLARYYASDDESSIFVRRLVEEKRRGIDEFLDRLIDQYSLADADIVGFTTMFPQTVSSFAMAKKLKDRKPEIITVMGGHACDSVTGQEFSRRIEQIDYFFSGQALVSFPEFVRCCLEGRREECDKINGIFSKTNGYARQSSFDGKTTTCKGTVSINLMGDELDINENIQLDYDDFLDSVDCNFPDGEVVPRLLFETSRGCWWARKSPCTFCGSNALLKKYQVMGSGNAILQLKLMFRYASRCSCFHGVDTILPGNYIKEVLPEIKAPAGTKIHYELRPTLGEKDIRILCEAGVTSIQPGLEALSTSTLKLMRKGTTAFGHIQFLKICSKYPMTLGWSILIGSPGEKEETYEKYLHDMPLLMHLHPPTVVYPVGFVRNSCYFYNPDESGLNLQPESFYGFTFPFGPEALSNIALSFADLNADIEKQKRWLIRLNQSVAFWRARWLNQDNKLESRLCLLTDGKGTVIYDSRSGEAVEYPATDSTLEVLKILEKPRRISDISSALKDLSKHDIESEMHFLTSRGLVFEEDGRYISLVIL